jgi:hypothetical protein
MKPVPGATIVGLLDRLFGSRSKGHPVAFELTGQWEGNYGNHGRECPIRASLVQVGSRISGTMVDVQTERTCSLFEATSEWGLPPGADERLDEQIRQYVPGSGAAPIQAKWILPEQSRLDGTIDGSFVRFTKVYQGDHFVGYQIGDKEIGHVIEHHSVNYSGRLSSDGRTIEGRWTILHLETGMRLVDGPFVLRRALTATSP